MPAPREFLSCDWGTSSFRLRHVRHGCVLAEIRDATGVKSLYERALATQVERAPLFENFLAETLAEIAGVDAIPLVISGMVSSTIGWRELAYAKTPLPLDGSGLRVETMAWPGHGQTLLVSGVATDDDVMRGEETQIVGIMQLPPVAALGANCLLLLPGTHSKHVRIQNQKVVGFCTHMTGELFDVLGRHSILRASVQIDAPIADFDAFATGVQRARENGLSASLFSVRARAVLAALPTAANTAYLSGLLIGAELATLPPGSPIVLAGAGPLANLYSRALSTLGRAALTLTSDEVEAATIAAHALILAQL